MSVHVLSKLESNNRVITIVIVAYQLDSTIVYVCVSEIPGYGPLRVRYPGTYPGIAIYPGISDTQT